MSITTKTTTRIFTHIKACNNCHTYERYINSNRCVACRKIKNAEYRNKNKDYMKRYFNNINHKLTNKLYLSMYRQLGTMERLNNDAGIDSIVNAFHHVDYSIDDLKAHLESKFVGDMSFDNYGEVWELDHVISINTCINNQVYDLNEVHSLLNIQPLFKAHNRQKNSKSMVEFLEENKHLASLYDK